MNKYRVYWHHWSWLRMGDYIREAENPLFAAEAAGLVVNSIQRLAGRVYRKDVWAGTCSDGSSMVEPMQ